MGMPTFVANGTFVSGTGTVTPGLPAGLATDDILLLFMETHQQVASVPTPNGGTWTQVADSPQGSGSAGANSSARITVYWSRYNGTQGAPTTNDPGDHISARISAFRGVKTTGDPWNQTSGAAGTSATASIPGDTTTVADCLVVIPFAVEDDGDDAALVINVDLASITQRFENTHAAGDQGYLVMFTGTKAAAGAYGSTTSVITPSGQVWAGMAIALEGAPAVRRARVSFGELEVPNALRRARVSFGELEVPNAARRARVSFTELEVPEAVRRAQISFAELEVPNAARRARVSFGEFEVPNALRRARVSMAELQVPDAGIASPGDGGGPFIVDLRRRRRDAGKIGSLRS